MPKQYLDDNGNPISSPTSTAKVYLDDNGNPMQQSAPAPEQPWYSRAWENLTGGAGLPANPVKAGWEDLKHLATQPVETLKKTGEAVFVTPFQAQGQLASQAKEEWNKGNYGRAALKAVHYALPIIGPSADQASEQMQQGDYLGGTARAVGTGLGTALGGKVMRNPEVPPTVEGFAQQNIPQTVTPIRKPLQGALAGKMDETPAGSQFTRRQVLQAARENGVNLDVADATGSGAAHAIKKANSVSIASKGVIERNQNANGAALNKWASNMLDSLDKSETPREVLGGQIRERLASDLEARKTAASEIFSDLDKNIGPNAIDGTTTIQAEAQKIISENKGYYDKHTELVPKQAWKIIGDLANNGSYSWNELHQLRSDLMDFYRNNPDVVKGRGEAWVQRMVATIDNAMTDASAGLSPQDLAEFRHANAIWEGVKTTYDNPQSPFFHAVRSQYPSQIPGMLTKATPELARQAQDILGDLSAPLQRHYVESLLQSKDGAIDLRALKQRLSKVDKAFLDEMIGPQNSRKLRMLGEVGSIVKKDVNPSGTAQVGVPATEISAFFSGAGTIPAVAEMGAQRVAAKASTNPKVLDYFINKPKPKPKMPKGWSVPDRWR